MMIDDILDPREAIINGVDRNVLNKAVVFNVQNVSDYYSLGTDQTDWYLDKHFPCIAPTAPVMWFEYTQSRQWFMKGKLVDLNNQGRVGVLIEVEGAEQFRNLYNTDNGDVIEARLKAEKARWLLDTSIFFRKSGSREIFQIAKCLLPVNGEGEFIPNNESGEVMLSAPPGLSTQECIKNFNTIHPALLALCFMHCKNVEVVKSPAHPEKLQKAREKRGALPFVRWRTVIIEPIRKIVAAANQGSDRLTPEALHIVRGHFKNFTDQGLFGKHKGRYFWPMHVRGDDKTGIVIKDYNVQSPISGTASHLQ